MEKLFIGMRRSAAAVGGAGWMWIGCAAWAAVPAYVPVGSYPLPAGAAAGAFDVLADGRLVTMIGDSIYRQDTPNGSSYTKIGSLPPGTVAGFGASFIRVSPMGDKIAIGDNQAGIGTQEVLLVPTAALDPSAPTPPTVVGAANYEASWRDNDTLYVTGVAGFGVAALVTEVRAPSVTSATARVVVENIGGASGGVAINGAYLFTANGYDNGPGGSATGEVRALSLAAIDGSASALDFEASGVPVCEALSGLNLGFDALGNLLVGGGDYDQPDVGFAAVIDGAAIAAALAGGPAAPDAAEDRLSPGGAFDFYNIGFNAATGEVLVTFFGSQTIYRYAAVPSPGCGAGLVIAVGVWLGRRRRA